MTEDKGILIQNVYYMLAYAFQELRRPDYDEVAAEEFENIHELFSAILARGIGQQLKQGLCRAYIGRGEDLTVLRGGLHINGTIRNKRQRKLLLRCEYDELSENNLCNRILKTAAYTLFRYAPLRAKFKTVLKRVLLLFDGVETMDPAQIAWSGLRFQRYGQSCRMLLNLCRFILEGLLLTTEKGAYKMAVFLDEENMARLYEKFLLAYYRRHHPGLRAAASYVAWNLDGGETGLLPVMKTDVTLRSGERTLIIDAKYYTHTMQVQERYGSRSIRSGHLYQIFAYVKNQDARNTGNVAGLLLYAKTGERIVPDVTYRMGGNQISVKTLDLNVRFAAITAQLDEIVKSHFG